MLPGKPQTYRGVSPLYKPPRFCKHNVYAGHNKMMKPARAALASQMETAAPLQDVPLTAFMEFYTLLIVMTRVYFRRPKVHFKNGELRKDAPKFVTKTPDVDNCVKFVLDALQPRVIANDKTVTRIEAEKKWCLTDTEEMTLIELHERV